MDLRHFLTVQVYLGEVTSVKFRGSVGAISQIVFTSGIVFNYALGAIRDLRYYSIALVGLGIVALFSVLMFWLPETPRWLVSKGYIKEAERVLVWLRGEKIEIKHEMDDIKKTVAARKRMGHKNVLKAFLNRSFVIPFAYVLTVFFFQQAGGVSATAAFAATIFSDAGIGNPRLTTIYAVGIASLLGNIATFFLVNFLSRVTLLVLSCTGMFLGCAVLGIHFFVTRDSLCSDSFANNSTLTMDTFDKPCNPHFGPLAVSSLFLYRFSFAIGMGPVPWILVAEFLPLSLRGFASGLVMTLTWTISSIVTGLYLEFVVIVQPWFAVWTFGLFNFTGALFIVVFLPETKGKTLEELERTFVKRANVIETVL